NCTLREVSACIRRVAVGLFNRRRDTPSETVENLRQQLAIAEANLELVQQQYIAATSLHGETRMRESVASLEHMFLSDPEWMRVTAASQVEFTEEGLRRIREICRVASIANPLLRRALSLRSAYVWGHRLEIQVRGNNTDDDVTKTVIHKIQDRSEERRVGKECKSGRALLSEEKKTERR